MAHFYENIFLHHYMDVTIAWASIQTNVSSNMVTVTVVTAIAIPLCNATNGAVNTAVICALIGMIASYAYATPPAHPAVALAIGSEKKKLRRVRY